MMQQDTPILEQLAEAVREFQHETTGHRPKSVAVMLSEDTLVVTLRDALAPAETILSRTPQGATQVQEFHRRLFATSSDSLVGEINRILGRPVLESTAEVAPSSKRFEHSFTNGTVVQVFLLSPEEPGNH